MHQQDLVLAQLREQAMGWLSADDRRNAAHLARTADVSETSVRRLLNGDALPSPQNSLKVLMTVTGIKNVRKLQARFPGPVANYLADKFPMLASEEGETTDAASVELEMELRDPEKAVILHRLSHRDNVTKKELFETIPTPRTAVALDDLIKKGFVRENGPYLEAENKTIAMLDYDALLRCSQRMEDLWFKSSNATVPGANLIRLYTESVSQKGYIKIQEILRKASYEIYQVMESEPGDIPMFFKAMIETMNQRQVSKGEEK